MAKTGKKKIDNTRAKTGKNGKNWKGEKTMVKTGKEWKEMESTKSFTEALERANKYLSECYIGKEIILDKIRSRETGEVLYDVVSPWVHSFCNKMYDPQAKTGKIGKNSQKVGSAMNPLFSELKRGVEIDKNLFKRLCNLSELVSELVYDDAGNVKTKIVDKVADENLKILEEKTYSDGIDLLHTAIIALLVQVDLQKNREPNKPVDLLREYKITRIKRKVYIKDKDSKAWETVMTYPLREVYGELREYVKKTSALSTDPKNGYSYIQDIATNPDTGEEIDIYYRSRRYADIGGYANTSLETYSADRCYFEVESSMLNKLNLTKRQVEILELVLTGRGYKAIGTYLGVSKQAIQNAVKAMQDKAIKAGYEKPAPYVQQDIKHYEPIYKSGIYTKHNGYLPEVTVNVPKEFSSVRKSEYKPRTFTDGWKKLEAVAKKDTH